MRAVSLSLGLVVLIGAVAPVAAQDRANGERIAKTWCAACHRVGPDVPAIGANDAAPSFSSVAQMRSTTESSLNAFLSTSHARMPDYSLTRKEIADVSAYILSLRK